jgi:hypothetical protein
MRSKHFFSIALCGLLLTAVSCKTRSRVDSVVVDPVLGVYSYASLGDTLEFKALNPKVKPFYVIFDKPYPCAETYLTVTGDKPGTCKVQTKSGFVRYRLSEAPPSMDSQPIKCLACQFLIIPYPIPPTGVPPQPATP